MYMHYGSIEETVQHIILDCKARAYSKRVTLFGRSKLTDTAATEQQLFNIFTGDMKRKNISKF